MAQSALILWMNGMRVGNWRQDRGGAHIFQYDRDWVDSPVGRALSLSLPFTPANVPHRGAIVGNFFDNLLPDTDAIRSRIRSRFSTRSTDAFDLLSAIGRDCVGAIQLLPPDQEPIGFDRVEGVPLNDGAVERAIAASLSGSRTFGQDEASDFRISLAGAQEKTAFLCRRGKWCRPVGATPTTHIFKLPLGLIGHLQMDMRDSIENEWLCAQLIEAFGLRIASCEIIEFGSRKVLSVERFDRALQPAGWIARLPQEDFCQALGLPSTQKYEADGGPGMRDILRVLDGSSTALDDKRAFVKAQIVYWMLAAVDGHAKNFSIFHERGGSYRLTPFYDVLSAWPIIGRGANKLDPHKAKLAMAVRSKNAHWKLEEIRARHWNAVTRAAGLGNAESLLQEIVAQTPRVLETVARKIPINFPAVVRDKVFEGLQRMAGFLVARAVPED
jgi:serine/threonine-protein kinase HipA